MDKLCKTLNISLLCFLIGLLGLNVHLDGAEKDWFIYLGDKKPPKAPQKSMSSAEALPPLPLPAVPLRRTERKKPPQPDYLIGKVIWGEAGTFVDSNQHTMEIADWNLCPTDVQKLLEQTRQIELFYHWSNINLSGFHYDPKQLPALLFSGVRTLRLDDQTIGSLRNYVLDGGMIVCDSIAGSPWFYESCREVFNKMFPESRVRILPLDHPLYHIIADIGQVTYPRGREIADREGNGRFTGVKEVGAPLLEGVYVGSRVGVLISKYGLGCGWNQNMENVQTLKQAVYFDIDSATRLGLNLAAYMVGYAEAGVLEGRAEVFGLADQRPPTDEFVFAQIKHGGGWNVHPNSAGALLMKLRRLTSVRVNLKRTAITLGKDDLADYPFLYLTGLDDFVLSQAEVEALQRFLGQGGFLLINNGLGLSTFDQAVRREMARVMGGAQFEPLPERHELYGSLFEIKEVQYSPVLRKAMPDMKTPKLLGATLGGELKVLYSPYDLEAGWLEVYYPMLRGYEPLSAQQLGMNIVTYILTH